VVVVYVDAGTKFLPGDMVATPGAIAAFQATGENMCDFLERHLHGDWGAVSEGDWQLNDQAVEDETRILSAYTLKDGTRFWIITEADRSSTCVLLPEEY
jgi:hypothetical protein